MRAVTIVPGKAASQRLEEIAEPAQEQGSLLVRALAVGICGTDRELIDGDYGEAPPGRERLVLGHESLGRVIEAPAESSFRTGDMVVGIVRHPDPVPCVNCALGEWDMCRNGRYTERGIKQADGFAAERWRNKPDTTDLGALNRKLVLNNNVVFGTVNANRRHYQSAVEALLKADNRWLGRLISREVPVETWSSALVRQPDDVKPVIVFQKG